MKPQPVRIALVGAGPIVWAHVSALRRVPGATIVGIADLNLERAKAAAATFGIPRAAARFAELSDQRLDVVHVLTPPEAHAAVALEALAARCHVYIEKPAATSVEDCDRIAATADACGRIAAVGHSLLRDPMVTQAVALVRSGTIGTVRSAEYHRTQSAVDYAGGPLPSMYANGGGPFRDVGIHGLYLLEMLLGDIVDAEADVRSVGRHALLYCDDWHATIRCVRGTGFLHLGWHVAPPQSLLVIHGDRGVIRADLFGMTVTVRAARRLPGLAVRVVNTLAEASSAATQVLANTTRAATGRIRRYHGVQALIEEFYADLAEGRRPAVDVRAARPAVLWTERLAGIGDSARRGWLASFRPPATARVLVTGGMGLIGRELVKRLLDEGETVRLLVRRQPPEDWIADARLEFVLGDLGDPVTVQRAMQGVRRVFHLGAATSGSAVDFEVATVRGTQNVVDAAVACAVSRFTYVSSLGVLHAGIANPSRAIREDWPLEPRAAERGTYTRTKLAAEQIVRAAVQERRLPAVILRPGEVIGHDGPALTPGIGFQLGRHVAVLGRGTALVPLVAVDDVVEALLLADQSQFRAGEIFHLVDPTPIRQRDAARAYLDRQRLGGRLLTLPAIALYALAVAVELLCAVVKRPAPFSRYRVQALMARRRFDCSAAHDRLRWSPVRGVSAHLTGTVEQRDAAVKPVAGVSP